MKCELVECELTPEGPRRGPRRSGVRARRTVTVNLAESPLAWLHARGHIDARLCWMPARRCAWITSARNSRRA